MSERRKPKIKPFLTIYADSFSDYNADKIRGVWIKASPETKRFLRVAGKILLPHDDSGLRWLSVSERLDEELIKPHSTHIHRSAATIQTDASAGIFYRVDLRDEDTLIGECFAGSRYDVSEYEESVETGEFQWVVVRVACIHAESGSYGLAYRGQIYVENEDSSVLRYLNETGLITNLIREARENLETILTDAR